MRLFTDEEFEMMISEMTNDDHPTYNMLCTIAEKTLRPKIKYWCTVDSVLCGRGMEDDIMQEVFIRLIKTTVTHFLMKEDHNGESNRNPDKFKSWMFKVAENIKRDIANSLRIRELKTRLLESEEKVQLFENEKYYDVETYDYEILAEAFKIVLESDVMVYKVLTWLAQSLFIIQFDVTKIQSNEVIISSFGEKSLFEMRDILFDFAKKIEWVIISPVQKERISRALNAELNGKTIGEIKYKDFFMKKGGKASISDWVNRMNRLVESRMKNEASFY